MPKILKLTGIKTFIGGPLGNHNIDHGDIIRVSDEAGDQLLKSERSGPPEVEPIKYFTEVKPGPDVYVKYDFVDDIKVSLGTKTTSKSLTTEGAKKGNPDADEDPSDSEQPPGVTKVEAKALRKQQQTVPATKRVRANRKQQDETEEADA